MKIYCSLLNTKKLELAGNDKFDVAIMVTVVASYGVAQSRWSSYCNYFG